MRKKYSKVVLWSDSLPLLEYQWKCLSAEGWKVYKPISLKFRWKKFDWSFRLLLRRQAVHEHDWKYDMITGKGSDRALIEKCYCGAARVTHKGGTFMLDDKND